MIKRRILPGSAARDYRQGIRLRVLNPGMRNLRRRNLHILEMARQGNGHSQIARSFNLSRRSIQVILRAFDERRQLAQRSAKLLEELRQADNLDAKWPTEELIDAIRPLTVTRTALVRHFQSKQAHTLSLRDVMDLAISETDDPVLNSWSHHF